MLAQKPTGKIGAGISKPRTATCRHQQKHSVTLGKTKGVGQAQIPQANEHRKGERNQHSEHKQQADIPQGDFLTLMEHHRQHKHRIGKNHDTCIRTDETHRCERNESGEYNTGNGQRFMRNKLGGHKDLAHRHCRQQADHNVEQILVLVAHKQHGDH